MTQSIAGQAVPTPAYPLAGSLRISSLVLFMFFLGSCAAPGPAVTVPENARVQDLYIVDCMLPGQVRQLGNTTYMTPRRPLRTTAQDCRIRGGEYVAYDRADYKTALKVWLPAAEEGDAAAQNTVGEIFEQGLGTEPNYEMAALWYERAARQGNKGALVNLATLFETGKGVEKNKLKALNLYRQAWGVGDDALVMKSDATRALVEQARSNISAREAERRAAAVAVAAAEVRGEERGRMEAPPVEKDEVVMAPPKEVSAAGRNFGRYYALIIGNADYELLDDLVTPVSDAERLGKVLRERYGFRVKLLPNGDDASLLRAMNQLNEELGEEDNLLIYYSGHGNRRKSGAYEVGYWLPVNAEPAPNDTFWVPTEQVSGHLARLKPRRIIVVADSSFAGLLADNPAFLLATDMANLRSEAYVELRYPNRSRLLLTSGKDYPLQEVGKLDQSVFADAFIQVLENNDSVLTAPVLYLQVLDELQERQPELNPQFKAIKRAGDEVGDFFFVRQS